MRQFPLWIFASVLPLLAGCADGEATPDVDAGPKAVDQCLASGDTEIILTQRGDLDAGVAPDGGLRPVGDYFRDCALGTCLETILADGDVETCMNACIDATDVAGLSTACRACYVEGFFCAQSACVLECLGSDPGACDACVDVNCDPRFYECAGI